LPRLGEAGHQWRQAVAAREIPRDEGLVDLVADEAEALEAIVGLAARVGNVAGRHADAERALGESRSGQRARQREGEEHDDHASHGILLVRLQRSLATARVPPQSAGPNCEPDEARGRPQPEAYVGVRRGLRPTENVALRAEPRRGEGRAESIWRSK